MLLGMGNGVLHLICRILFEYEGFSTGGNLSIFLPGYRREGLFGFGTNILCPGAKENGHQQQAGLKVITTKTLIVKKAPPHHLLSIIPDSTNSP
ncbi:hypothetical protein CEXT_222911 [Caerostris extrusa]|uniref:Uncharacterized protein n=1 Tax=Caerostris extrusa TaxID=172846 RepID=A0AAV4NMA0_CAEEX|nr:hypothetical protein CEXT_222911 [Caerostris extrusa]